MRSSKLFAALAVLGALLFATPAEAQQTARGFASDRLYSAAPGSGWVVLDDLEMHGGLGGAMTLAAEYAHNPFHVPDVKGRLDVVSGQAFANIGFAATFDRFKIYANFISPISSTGTSGVADGVSYRAPNLSLGTNPDTIADLRLGANVRFIGRYDGPFRLGLQFQLWVPSGERSDYVSDEYYRAINRVLAAGDIGLWDYAAHIGIQDRTAVDLVPGGPRGAEMLFGAAVGHRFTLAPRMALSIGPEVFGQTAFREFFGHYATGVEALGTAKIDWGNPLSPRLRLKASAGGGLDAQFGTPSWRTVVSLDVMDFFTH